MAEPDGNDIYLSTSPHIAQPLATPLIMRIVVLCLLPIAAFGVWLYGLPALVTLIVSVASTVIFESLFRLAIKKDVRAGDFSAVITGLLLALVLPPTTPPWMTALGAFFAVVVAKEFFGGLGANVFNPALSGRAFLFVSFSKPLTTWIAPRAVDAVSSASTLAQAYTPDAVTSATPLSYIKPAEGAVMTASDIASKLGLSSDHELYRRMFLGLRAGSIGESAIFLILIFGAILVATKIIDWRAPVAMVATAVAVTWIAGIDPVLTLLSGGLLFGAVFMATDYATSPVTPWGRLLFGAGAGLITALVRLYGGYPESVMFSILIMNAVTPFLNKIIPRMYGKVSRVRKGESPK